MAAVRRVGVKKRHRPARRPGTLPFREVVLQPPPADHDPTRQDPIIPSPTYK